MKATVPRAWYSQKYGGGSGMAATTGLGMSKVASKATSKAKRDIGSPFGDVLPFIVAPIWDIR
jgi:hypothetical protein